MTTRLIARLAAAAALALAAGGCMLTTSATMSELQIPPPGKPPTVTDRPLPPLDLSGLAPDEQVGATIYHQYARAVVNVTAYVAQQRLLGGQRIDQGIQMTSRDTFESDASVFFFNSTSDDGVAPYFSGCAKASAVRFE